MNRKNFITILCQAQGLICQIKAIHWAKDDMANKHKILDDIYAALNDFMDNFAEDGMTIFGPIDSNEIQPILTPITEDDTIVSKCEKFAKICKQFALDGDEVEFAGLNSVCDEFVHNMKINLFRYGMN